MTPLQCEKVREMLRDFTRVRLSREEHKAVVEHLQTCEDCRAFQKNEQALDLALSRLPPRFAPSSLKARLQMKADPTQPAATPPHAAAASASKGAAAAGPGASAGTYAAGPGASAGTYAAGPGASAGTPGAGPGASAGTSTSSSTGNAAPANKAAAAATRLRRRTLLVGGVAAAAGIGIGVLGVSWNDRRASDFLVNEAVNDHLRVLYDAHATEVESGGLHQVKPWFEGRLDFAPVLDFEGDNDFTLTGGAVAYFIDRKAAVFLFKRRLHLVTVLVFRADGLPWPRVGTRKLGRVNASASRSRGFSSVLYRDGDLGYALVSDVDPSTLERLAEKLAPAPQEK